MGRLMNRYMYGKAGQGDFKKSDLPTNRKQLFFAMLRIRLSAIFRLNLMTCVVFLPTIIVLFSFATKIIVYESNLAQYYEYKQILNYNEQGEPVLDEKATEAYAAEWKSVSEAAEGSDVSPLYVEASLIYSRFLMNWGAFKESIWAGFTGSLLMLLLPCIMITGPVQAGMAHICRNWSRDEHAFIWSDFIDAVKENWKQGLGISTLTGLMVVFIPTALMYYWGMGQGSGGTSLLWYVPVGILLCLSLIWFLGLAFFYPTMVGYRVTFRQLVKNSLTLSAAKLPMVLGMRLCNLLPVILGYVVCRMFTSVFMYVLIILSAYYILFGNAFARFCHASYANSVFDKYINSKIPGATVNRGMNTETDEDDEDDETESGNTKDKE